VGVDPDPIVMTNTDLDEARVNNGVRLPFPDAMFDGAYSDWTLEHVGEPLAFLREVRRVLKPGASYFARTTNRLHYVTVVSAFTPHWFHRLIANRARRLPAHAHDPWPTRYQMNTPRHLRRFALRAGFQPEIRLLEPEPAYLMFHPAAFLFGVGYERLVNRVSRFATVRLTILIRMRAS
jgi:SAM-dependent methyltransferase